MKRLIFFAAVVAMANVAYPQTDFRKGYIVIHTNDTVRGLVDYREGGRAFKVCDFRLSPGQPVTTYEPGDLVGYGFDKDRVFESREINLKDQPPTQVFLEILVRGLVTLYRIDNTFLVEKEGEGLQELINETKKVYVEGRLVVRNSNQHISVLNILLFDCPSIRPVISKVRLSQKSLTKLIETYNQCKGAPAEAFKSAKPWTRAEAGLIAGFAVSKLEFTHHPEYEHLWGTFTTSRSPVVGISAQVLSPRVSERFSFHFSALYSFPKYYGFYQTSRMGPTIRNYVTIELPQLKVPVGFRYTFPKRSFTPYFNAGVSSTIQLNASSNWIREWELGGLVETFEQEALPIEKYQFGAWAGAGVLRSLNENLTAFAEVRYEQTDGIAGRALDSQTQLKSTIKNIQLVFGITF